MRLRCYRNRWNACCTNANAKESTDAEEERDLMRLRPKSGQEEVMRRGNRRIRKARAAKRRWLVAEHLTRAGDAAGPRLMEVLIRTWLDRQRNKML